MSLTTATAWLPSSPPSMNCMPARRTAPSWPCHVTSGKRSSSHTWSWRQGRITRQPFKRELQAAIQARGGRAGLQGSNSSRRLASWLTKFWHSPHSNCVFPLLCRFKILCDTYNQQLLRLQGLKNQLVDARALIDSFDEQAATAERKLLDGADPASATLATMLDGMYRHATAGCFCRHCPQHPHAHAACKCKCTP